MISGKGTRKIIDTNSTLTIYIEGYTTIHNNGIIKKNDVVIILYIKENIDFVWQKHYLANCVIRSK